MTMKLLALLIASSILMAGCDYTIADAATRVRYALFRAEIWMRLLRSDTLTITVDPDHWPGGCRNNVGYKLVLSPDKGDKQVAGDEILVTCNDRRPHYTGFGTNYIYVAREMAVEKKSGEEVQIALRRSSSRIEIVELK